MKPIAQRFAEGVNPGTAEIEDVANQQTSSSERRQVPLDPSRADLKAN